MSTVPEHQEMSSMQFVIVKIKVQGPSNESASKSEKDYT